MNNDVSHINGSFPVPPNTRMSLHQVALIIVGAIFAGYDTIEMGTIATHFVGLYFSGASLDVVEMYQFGSFIFFHLPILIINIILFAMLIWYYNKKIYKKATLIAALLITSSLFFNFYIFFVASELPVWLNLIVGI